MHEWMTALSDPARWRIALLLADRPRSVGVVADMTGLRQPQASKHLQTLERSGIAVSRRSGQRRIYALAPEALESLAAEFQRVADLAVAGRAEFDAYSASVDAETKAAVDDRWADSREYLFRRALPAAAATVWQYLSAPELLSKWWSPDDLRLAKIEWGTRPGQRVMQVYVDADDRRGAVVVGEASGQIESVDPGHRLSFVLSPKLPDGSPGFRGHYDWLIAATESGSNLEVRLRLDDTAVLSAEFIAGIELGWNQSLDRLVRVVRHADNTDNEGEQK